MGFPENREGLGIEAVVALEGNKSIGCGRRWERENECVRVKLEIAIRIERAEHGIKKPVKLRLEPHFLGELIEICQLGKIGGIGLAGHVIMVGLLEMIVAGNAGNIEHIAFDHRRQHAILGGEVRI